MNKQGRFQEKAKDILQLTSSNRSELMLFGLLAGLGAIASYFSVNIPHTEVYIDGRFAFGFMGFALLRRWWAALLLAALLSVTGFHQVPPTVYLPGNMLYAVPALVTIRLVHARLLARWRNLVLYGAGWFLLVLVCYQLFTTPAVWAVVAMLRETPIWPAVLAGWREQPFWVESVLVGFGSALGMMAARSHRELSRSRRELATTLDSIGDGVIATDPQGRITRMNSVAQSLTGWPLAEARGKPLEEVFQIVNAQTGRPVANPVTRVLREGVVVGLANHTQLVARDGTVRQIADSAAPIKQDGGPLLGTVMVFRDVTEEYEARAALRQSEARYRSLTENFPNGALFLFDAEFRYLAANGKGFAQAGLSSRDVVGKRVNDVFPELWDSIRAYHEAALRGEEGYYEVEYKGRLYSNQVVPVTNETGLAGQGIVITQDITARRQAEEEKVRLAAQLNQAQKMESVGRLAGGVAHDLNNLLTPILGFGELLLVDYGGDEARQADVEKIVQAARRARDLVRQLLAFSRKQVLELEPADLNKILTEFEKLLRRMIREDIAIEITPTPSLPRVKADVGQLEQVIMNLAVNAQDAMPDGGVLTIQTGLAKLDRAYAAEHEGVKPGPYVMLCVSDTGCGMDAGTCDRIFEPFFTTKAEEGGTGLGLATVYGIVKQHGGHIWVYSEPGQGATFKVYLPVSPKSDRPQKSAAVEGPTNRRGSETVLVVEDNRYVRRIAHTILERQGYAVLVAENGKEAVTLLDRHRGPVHLLLTDVVMPEMNGRALFDRLNSQFPGMKVLFMSGYTDEVIAHRGVLDEGVNFIQKPFSVQALVDKVRTVLDED